MIYKKFINYIEKNESYSQFVNKLKPLIKYNKNTKENLKILQILHNSCAVFKFSNLKTGGYKMLSSIFSLVEEILATAGAGEKAQKIVSAVFDGILGILG